MSDLFGMEEDALFGMEEEDALFPPGVFVDIASSPISYSQWVEYCIDRTYRTIGSDSMNGIRVSTVWVGLASNTFETMVFGGWMDRMRWRYETVEQAIRGHLIITDHALHYRQPLTRCGRKRKLAKINREFREQVWQPSGE